MLIKTVMLSKSDRVKKFFHLRISFLQKLFIQLPFLHVMVHLGPKLLGPPLLINWQKKLRFSLFLDQTESAVRPCSQRAPYLWRQRVVHQNVGSCRVRSEGPDGPGGQQIPVVLRLEKLAQLLPVVRKRYKHWLGGGVRAGTLRRLAEWRGRGVNGRGVGCGAFL